MFDQKRYLRNILLNWGAYFTSLAVGFVIAPMVLPLIPGSGWPAIILSFAVVSLLLLTGVSALILEKKDRIGFLALIRSRLAPGKSGGDR